MRKKVQILRVMLTYRQQRKLRPELYCRVDVLGKKGTGFGRYHKKKKDIASKVGEQRGGKTREGKGTLLGKRKSTVLR